MRAAFWLLIVCGCSSGGGGDLLLDCERSVVWHGTVVADARSVILEACVNATCFTRTVNVSADGKCRSEIVWVELVGTEACAARLPDGKLDIQAAMDLTSASLALGNGDNGLLVVKDLLDGQVLYRLESEIQYPSGQKCPNAEIHFGEVTPAIDAGSSD